MSEIKGKGKVIVADSGQTIQKVIGLTLKNENVHVESVHSWPELQTRLSLDSQLDLLLVDADLGKNHVVDHIEVFKELKKGYPHLPVIALIGAFDQIDEKKIRNSGVIDCITKPFESGQFIQKIRSILVSSQNQYSVKGESFDRLETQNSSNLDVYENDDLVEFYL